jgi:hypothetical protein
VGTAGTPERFGASVSLTPAGVKKASLLELLAWRRWAADRRVGVPLLASLVGGVSGGSVAQIVGWVAR